MGGISDYLKFIGLALVGVAVLFDIIGLATTNWTSAEVGGTEFHSGLFEICYTSCKEIKDSLAADWLKATRAMVILGLLCGIAGIVLVALYCFVKQCGTKMFQIILMAVCFVTAFLTFLGFVIFAAKFDTGVVSMTVDLSWSFALTVVAFIFYIAAGVVFAAEMKMAPKT